MTLGSPLHADRAGSGKRILLMVAAAVIAPVALSYGVYYLSPRGAFTNYGELLPTQPAPAITGMRADGSPFRIAQAQGRWTIVVASGGACDAACTQKLHATRQARTMQGRERERIERLWLVPDGVRPDPNVLAEHPDVVVVRTTPADVAALPKGADAIYLIDPIGNQVLAWPRDADIKALARDLTRVLRASRIG
jgi:hypothetical protein